MLTWGTGTTQGAMVLTRPELLPRTMSGSVALPQPRCVSAHGSWYYGRQWRCPGSGMIPWTMLVPECHAAARAKLIRVACIPTKGRTDVQSQTVFGGHVCTCIPTTDRVWLKSVTPATIEGHPTVQSATGFLTSGALREAMLESRNHVLLEPYLSERSAVLPETVVTSGPKLLVLAMSRSMVLPQLESVLMSDSPCNLRGPCETCVEACVQVWGLCRVGPDPQHHPGRTALPHQKADFDLRWLWDKRPPMTPLRKLIPPLIEELTLLSLGILVPPFIMGVKELNRFLTWGERSQWTSYANPDTTQKHIQGFQLALPNIHLIYDLLEHINGTNSTEPFHSLCVVSPLQINSRPQSSFITLGSQYSIL